MTEEEAKRKWCPLTFPAEEADKCAGSYCMAWRWEEENGYFKRVTDDMKLSGMDSKEAMETIPRKGWCGLAGKP